MTHENLDSYDHYVSATYLKRFSCSPNKVYMFRKEKDFVKDVPVNTICGQYGGDVCDHFTEKLGLRKILADLEPIWPIFINAVETDKILDFNSVHSKPNEPSFLQKVSLYIAYLRCLSPTVNRLTQENHEDIANTFIVPTFADIKDDRLDGAARESIRNGNIIVKIGDEQYYKAMGINALPDICNDFYGRDWQILRNKTNIKFITSDTPVIPLTSVRYSPINGKAPIYLPLTPEYALLIHPQSNRNLCYKNVTQKQVEEYNKEVVKWAEDKVISSTLDSGISKLVDKYRDYRAKNEIIPVKSRGSIKIITRHTTGLKKSA